MSLRSATHWLLRIGPACLLVGLLIALVTSSPGGSDEVAPLGAEPVESRDTCDFSFEELSMTPAEFTWFEVNIDGEGAVDDWMTQRWRDDAEQLGPLLSPETREAWSTREAVDFGAGQPVGHVADERDGLPVLLSDLAVERALEAGASTVLAGTQLFRERNLASIVVSVHGSSTHVVSHCGADRYPELVMPADSIEDAGATIAAMRSDFIESTAADAETGGREEGEVRASTDGWTERSGNLRSVQDDDLPDEVAETLLPVMVYFDVPADWTSDERTLCMRTDFAWVGCTSLGATDPDGRLLPFRIAVPDGTTEIEVVLNERSAPFESEFQLVIGSIDTELISRVDGSVTLVADSPLPEDDARTVPEMLLSVDRSADSKPE